MDNAKTFLKTFLKKALPKPLKIDFHLLVYIHRKIQMTSYIVVLHVCNKITPSIEMVCPNLDCIVEYFDKHFGESILPEGDTLMTYDDRSECVLFDFNIDITNKNNLKKITKLFDMDNKDSCLHDDVTFYVGKISSMTTKFVMDEIKEMIC